LDLAIDRERHARIRYELSPHGRPRTSVTQRGGVSIFLASSASLGKRRSAQASSTMTKALDMSQEALPPEAYTSNSGGSAWAEA